MFRFPLIAAAIALFCGCDSSEPVVWVKDVQDGHNYRIPLESVRSVMKECAVPEQHAACICMERTKANRKWLVKYEEKLSQYLQQGHSSDDVERDVNAVMQERQVSRMEAVAIILDFPELPSLMSEAELIGHDKAP